MRKSIVAVLASLATVLLPALALAEEAAPAAAAGDWKGWIAVGAGLAIGIAAFGCGVGQGLTAFGALQGIARNPSAAGKIQTPMILGLALIESLCIYALVIAFFLQGKV